MFDLSFIQHHGVFDLSNNKLSGLIREELGNCMVLVDLLFNNTMLSGSILLDIGDSLKLQGLYLGNNQLIGSILGSLVLGIDGPTFFCVALAVFGYITVKKWRGIRSGRCLKAKFVPGPRKFSYKELHSAIRGVHSSRILGCGAFGNFYKAFFSSLGSVIALKRTKHSHEGKLKCLLNYPL